MGKKKEINCQKVIEEPVPVQDGRVEGHGLSNYLTIKIN